MVFSNWWTKQKQDSFTLDPSQIIVLQIEFIQRLPQQLGALKSKGLEGRKVALNHPQSKSKNYSLSHFSEAYMKFRTQT